MGYPILWSLVTVLWIYRNWSWCPSISLKQTWVSQSHFTTWEEGIKTPYWTWRPLSIAYCICLLLFQFIRLCLQLILVSTDHADVDPILFVLNLHKKYTVEMVPLCTWVKKYDRISMTNVRKNLHWLPIKARIDFKILVLVWKACNEIGPKYLSDLLDKNTQHPILVQLIQTY